MSRCQRLATALRGSRGRSAKARILSASLEKAAAHYSAEIAARRWKKVYVADVACEIERAATLLGDHKAYLSTAGRRATIVRSGGKPSTLKVPSRLTDAL